MGKVLDSLLERERENIFCERLKFKFSKLITFHSPFIFRGWDEGVVEVAANLSDDFGEGIFTRRLSDD